MIRDLVVSGLAIPLLVVALLAGILGFEVTRRVAHPPLETTVRLSVVALPPAATPTPTPTPAPSIDNSGGSSGGGNCPAGCQCSSPGGTGIVIVCH